MSKKNKLYRILKIISLLSNRHKKWKVRELAGLFGVSPRTIYRDFELMEEMRIPIYNDPDSNTYAIMEDFYFKPPKINKEEAMALLLVGQVFQEEIFPYREELNTAVAKIINSLSPSIKKVIDDISSQIIYQNGAFVNLSPFKDIIEMIEKAMKKSITIELDYYSLSSDQLNSRQIDPYNIAYKNGAGYLIGYCHLRSAVRMFRVDRIRGIKLTDLSFEILSDFTIDKYLENTWGVERGDNEERIILIFKGKAARLVKEMEWHPSQHIIDLPGNRIKFEVITGSRKEIKNWILSYGSSVEVIRPADLKEEIADEIEKMQKIYK
ncbi:WYL domain-containing protein [Iocasia frigidifontis]|uniref:WYL domain-containing protein n=1 Tax=Iocasia fonsfrigidae TaxID=2682810 RepID=A0A8A7KCH8_9FIRM|nr:YafY family protein [Iocasia fonsfrigidae]QTL99151.1 WYL domain-containing protein [Iocasia fonsfrigidae]